MLANVIDEKLSFREDGGPQRFETVDTFKESRTNETWKCHSNLRKMQHAYPPKDFEPSLLQTTKNISQLYEENRSHKFHTTLNKADAYLEKVMRRIDMSNLYKVHDYLHTSEE